jgi:Tfp pilus assembly protein PilF
MRKAVEFGPEVAAYHHDLGSSLAEQRKLVDAEAAFREATNLDSNYAMAWYSLGTCLLQQEKLQDAESAFRSAIQLKPDYADAHFNLGTALSQQGKYREAEAAYRRYIELAPDDPNAHGLLGDVLLKQGRFEDAIQATRDAKKLLGFLSPMHLSANQQIRECERLLELEKRLPGVLDGSDAATVADLIEMAELCQRYKGRHRDAVALYEAAFVKEPTSRLYTEKLCRYNAGCAAIQVVAGSDAGAPPLSEADQAQYRSRALTWIRMELDALTNVHQISGRLFANQLQSDLRSWQSDPDLACVREAESLSRLPEDEQQAWRTLWKDVQSLVDRVSATGP